MKKADNQLLVIFGASGDLTSRKLLPSLFELYVRGLLPDRFCILGAARTAYGDEEFRAEQHTHILEAQKGKTYDEGLIDDFLENVYYLAFDSTNADEYYKLRERIEFLQEKHDLPDKIIYYLATPPVMYEIVPQCLLEWFEQARVSGWFPADHRGEAVWHQLGVCPPVERSFTTYLP